MLGDGASVVFHGSDTLRLTGRHHYIADLAAHACRPLRALCGAPLQTNLVLEALPIFDATRNSSHCRQKKPRRSRRIAIDLRVVLLKHIEITGEKMFILALESGIGSGIPVHGTFDMAAWQAQQFQEQFDMQPRATICADCFHAMEYVAGAAPAAPAVVAESHRAC